MGVSIPLGIVNATLLLSGLLGLQIAVPDGSGGTKRIETNVPINITNSNPVFQVIPSDPGLKGDIRGAYPGINDPNRIFNPNSIETSLPRQTYQSTTRPPPIVLPSPTKTPSRALIPNTLPKPRLSSPSQSQVCGSDVCNSQEMCVSWEWKHNPSGLLTTVLPTPPYIYQECHPHDGHHYTKVSPIIQDNLCQAGLTHSIIPEESSCLKNNNLCDVVWKYKCVNETDSPHSCDLRRCNAEEFCLETIHCVIDAPCIILVECRGIPEVRSFN